MIITPTFTNPNQDTEYRNSLNNFYAIVHNRHRTYSNKMPKTNVIEEIDAMQAPLPQKVKASPKVAKKAAATLPEPQVLWKTSNAAQVRKLIDETTGLQQHIAKCCKTKSVCLDSTKVGAKKSAARNYWCDLLTGDLYRDDADCPKFQIVIPIIVKSKPKAEEGEVVEVVAQAKIKNQEKFKFIGQFGCAASAVLFCKQVLGLKSQITLNTGIAYGVTEKELNALEASLSKSVRFNGKDGTVSKKICPKPSASSSLKLVKLQSPPAPAKKASPTGSKKRTNEEMQTTDKKKKAKSASGSDSEKSPEARRAKRIKKTSASSKGSAAVDLSNLISAELDTNVERLLQPTE